MRGMTNRTRRPISALRRVFAGARSWLAWTLLFVIASTPAHAQRGEPTVTTQLSTGVAKLGEPIELRIVVENARQTRITRMPSVEGLTLGQPAGPYTKQFTQFVNGRVSERLETIWSVSLRASSEGAFEVPPFELEVDGKAVRTRPVSVKVLRDMRGEDLGFFEVRTSSPKVVEGQPFTLELRFGWDEATNTNYANLSLPWWGALPGTIELAREEDPAATEGVVVNDKIEVAVERVRSGAQPGRRTYRLVRTFLPTRPGKLTFPTSFLEFGELSRRQMFRPQRKLSNYFVRAEPFELEVVALPNEGQPFDYSGAVGTLAARADADTRDVVVGDSIKLTVTWSGEGNLEFFEAPDLGLLDSFRAFQVYGSTEDKSFERRRVVYDIAPLEPEVESIPAVPLTVFDPVRGEYTTVETTPIPVRVRPLERPIELDDGSTERFERDTYL